MITAPGALFVSRSVKRRPARSGIRIASKKPGSTSVFVATGNCAGNGPSGVKTINQSPCIGSTDAALADITAGSWRRRCTINCSVSLMRSGSAYDEEGRLTLNVTRFSGSKPGLTARARAKLRIMSPAPTVSTSAKATSLTMSTRRPLWRARFAVEDRSSVRNDRSASVA